MLSEEKVKSILLTSQYIMILPFFYFVLFIIFQMLTLVYKINGMPANSPRAPENFLCLGCRLWLSLVFPIIYRVILLYVYFWSNLLFSILTSVLLISIYSRKYKLSVVKYPRQFKWMQLEIKRFYVTLFLYKYILMISVCHLSLLLIVLLISSPLNIDLSGVSINNPLALPSVFVLVTCLGLVGLVTLGFCL